MEGNFQRLESLLAITRTKIQATTNYEARVHCRKVSATFSRSLKFSRFQGVRQKCNFFADRVRKRENPKGTSNGYLQSRFMVGGAKVPSFLAIFCSSACAHMLVHVSCSLISDPANSFPIWASEDMLAGPLAAQFEIPPCRTKPFRDSIAAGGIAPLCLVFMWYRASIAEIPLCGGGLSHIHFACSARGNAQKGGRGYRTQLAMLRHQSL